MKSFLHECLFSLRLVTIGVVLICYAEYVYRTIAIYVPDQMISYEKEMPDNGFEFRFKDTHSQPISFFTSFLSEII